MGRLQRHAEALSPDGVILDLHSQSGALELRQKLLRGTWDYMPSGLLDETHMRWFSLRSMREGLAKHGLVPCDVYARVFDRDRASQFSQTIAPALTALGIDTDEYARRAAPLQYVWRVARPRNNG